MTLHPSPDVDNNGFISKDELNELFRAANLPLPGYRIREIIQELTKTSNQLTFDEFTQVRSEVTVLLFTGRGKVSSLKQVFKTQKEPIRH